MEVLNEHKLKYLNRRVLELEELRNCLTSNNFEFAMMIGHKLKGNGETFGFPNISVIGNLLEKAALDKDRDKVQENIEKLALSVQEGFVALS